MKKFLNQEKGISLISLSIMIIVMGIITTVLLYNIKDTRDVTNVSQLYSDIDNLNNKVSDYYSTYGKIPAKQYTGLDNIITTNWIEPNDPRGANDTGNFLVIDLSAMEGISLNYGRDYEEIKNETSISNEQTDIYIINDVSHNIFYLKGLEVENKTYYTNQDIDETKVDLRYVDGIKIFDDYTYESGSKESGIIISKTEDGAKKYYKWIDLENSDYNLSSDGTYLTYVGDSGIAITIELPQVRSDFIISAKQNRGFYLEQKDSGDNRKVLYFDVAEEKWSTVYDTESIYKDENGDTAYIPAGFMVSKTENKNTVSSGLIIKKPNNAQLNNPISNLEFVWIDVPDKVLKNKSGESEIETALNEYVERTTGYADQWYDGCGFTEQSGQYNQMKRAIYNSIKKKGGFWMSTDEVGSGVNLTIARESANTINNDENIEINADLLLGIQWDLACKFINENADGDATKLNISNFDTNNLEWTLEHNTAQAPSQPLENNSVIRAGSGGITSRTAYNYNDSDSNLAYRIMIY